MRSPSPATGPDVQSSRGIAALLGRALELAKRQATPHRMLFALILLVGVFARTWEFGKVPPGLRLDEASSAVDAYDLLHYGLDRNGDSLPVQFISWGSGQNALYAYLMMPFLAVGGLDTLMVRLPMLITGILTMPLVYAVAKRTWSETAGLMAMFLLAISPWHIILSRWGLESNLLPFVFLCGYWLLLRSGPGNNWFVLANLFFGLCLYAYGTAYVAVPIFLACAFPILILARRLSLKVAIAGLLVFLAVGWPIALLLAVNSLHLETVHLGPFTVPRMPTQARYETMTAGFRGNPLIGLSQNLGKTLRLLWRQSDGLVWNSDERYGYFYGRLAYGRLASGMAIAPLTFAGVLIALPRRSTPQWAEHLLLLSWLVAAIAIGVVQPVNVNRINLVFIPLILFLAGFLDWMGKRVRAVPVISVLLLCLGFVGFNLDYHGDVYRSQSAPVFESGIIPAIEFARQAGDGPICLSGGGGDRYIFALYADPMNPIDYLRSVRYVDNVSYGEVESFGRYTIGTKSCPADRTTVYVLWGETPPANGIAFQKRCFDLYCVYSP